MHSIQAQPCQDLVHGNLLKKLLIFKLFSLVHSCSSNAHTKKVSVVFCELSGIEINPVHPSKGVRWLWGFSITQVRSLTCIAKDATHPLGPYFLHLHNGDTACRRLLKNRGVCCEVQLSLTTGLPVWNIKAWQGPVNWEELREKGRLGVLVALGGRELR